MSLPSFGLQTVDWEQRIDYDALRVGRLERAKGFLERSELGALLCFDTPNIRYITATAIGTWGNDKLCRFCLLPRGGEPILTAREGQLVHSA
jgi:Xaa-Pro aminopeptidase